MKPLKFVWILSAAFLLSCTSESEPEESADTSSDAGAAVEESVPPEVEATKITNVGPNEAEELIREKKGIVVLDIRTPDEYSSGHIAGAKNIDFNGDSFEGELAKLDLNTPYLVHCRSGGRSAHSLPVFQKLGFKEIYHLSSGMNGWAEAGKSVTK